MEHFRWGKPVGRKRRPIKIYTTNGLEEESAELFPGEMKKRELAGEMMTMDDNEGKLAEGGQEEAPDDSHEKKDEMYKMKHFRWGGLPASKRYGGFMKSWDERSQRPLITLFKNVINKEAQEEKREQWGGRKEGGMERRRADRKVLFTTANKSCDQIQDVFLSLPHYDRVINPWCLTSMSSKYEIIWIPQLLPQHGNHQILTDPISRSVQNNIGAAFHLF